MVEHRVIEVIVPSDNRYGNLSESASNRWQAGYCILFNTDNVKHISIENGDGYEIIVSKIVHPYGVRYYVLLPGERVATGMLADLTDVSRTIFELRHSHSFGFICDKSDEYMHLCHHDIKRLSVEKALTVAEVLRDLGNF